MPREQVGAFEQLVLLALLRLKSDAYGRTIHLELQTRVGREIAIGQIYIALERLEAKGFVTSALGGATSVRGGRAKRYFEITGVGESALQEALRAIDALRVSAGSAVYA
jgi:PadR family transcriptional regulator PadR